ncbi:uncharacterized protein LOC110160828 [Boleophthalmus pectinirostris]|uniref:uncharacterized protein LOC110160828 n=1 Tax=Boleophthalmus pectinirostris TaxID=150288 RepID=UPI00242CBFC0|nr:uncharacterized protein LOC110160828 [Boleophthalmus pectinirostris]
MRSDLLMPIKGKKVKNLIFVLSCLLTLGCCGFPGPTGFEGLGCGCSYLAFRGAALVDYLSAPFTVVPPFGSHALPGLSLWPLCPPAQCRCLAGALPRISPSLLRITGHLGRAFISTDKVMHARYSSTHSSVPILLPVSLFSSTGEPSESLPIALGCAPPCPLNRGCSVCRSTLFGPRLDAVILCRVAFDSAWGLRTVTFNHGVSGGLQRREHTASTVLLYVCFVFCSFCFAILFSFTFCFVFSISCTCSPTVVFYCLPIFMDVATFK